MKMPSGPDSHLIISEDFYSIQGEGPSAGVPAVFLRLTGCNLSCKGFSFNDPITSEHLGCDSAQVWKKGKKYRFNEIIEKWKDSNWLDKLYNGAHLVITGGEPVLQQTAIINFLELLDQSLAKKIYVEMETNATKKLLPKFEERLNQINASPKLSNNGDSRIKTYKPKILASLANLKKTRFKFVVSKPEDIDEIIQQYVIPFKVDHRNIWLMPEGTDDKILSDKSKWIVELCKKYLMNYSPRLQIHIWGEVTGV